MLNRAANWRCQMETGSNAFLRSLTVSMEPYRLKATH
jgi:hypothetical protein